MEKLYVLGTGNAMSLKCYNTCFALRKEEEYFIVDGGGGNQILSQLEKLNISITSIHNIFISHNHTDHILGVLWLIRVIGLNIARNRGYIGNLNIYASDESMEAISTLVKLLAPRPVRDIWGAKIILHIVKDMETLEILGCKTTFINICAKKDKQFGFKMEISNDKFLTFLGDEPFNDELLNIAKDSEWLLHEAFCLDNEKDEFKPQEKGHCTVKESSIIAKNLNPKNLVLWHTEDNDLKNRKKLYNKEARKYFDGNVLIPDDLDIINLLS